VTWGGVQSTLANELLSQQFKSAVEAIANINPEMFITSVSGIVTSTLRTFQAQGASAITWQQAELAMFLVYSWSEYSATKGESTASTHHRKRGVGLI
jgi:hypothetical protein